LKNRDTENIGKGKHETCSVQNEGNRQGKCAQVLKIKVGKNNKRFRYIGM